MLTRRVVLSLLILLFVGSAGAQQWSGVPFKLNAPSGLAELGSACPLPENFVTMSGPELSAKLTAEPGLRATDGTYKGTTSQGRAITVVISGDKVTEIKFTYSCPGQTLLFSHFLSSPISGGSISYIYKPFDDSCTMPILGYEFLGTVDSATALSGTVLLMNGWSWVLPCCTLNLTWSASLPAPPDAPTGLAATAYPTKKVDLSWTDNAGDETEYRVERRLDSGVSFTQIATLAPDATSHTDDTVEKGMSYVYRVLACNGIGCSSPSNEATATVPAMGFFIGN